MKAVVKSVHPEACERIASGRQKFILSKSAPKEVPFKGYIYETKKRYKTFFVWNTSDGLVPIPNGGKVVRVDKTISRVVYNRIGRGKIIGEFICDRVICYQAYYGNSGEKHLTNLFGIEVRQTCLTEEELFNYIVGNKKEGTGWLWHISELKIYDKPKELGEYGTVCEFWRAVANICIEDCPKATLTDDWQCNKIKPLTRPPQSWQYVEEL